MAMYRIKSGASFRDGDVIKVGGDLIELDLDMAILHRDKIDPVLDVPEIVQTPARAPDSEA
jgi:hypothetical protein